MRIASFFYGGSSNTSCIHVQQKTKGETTDKMYELIRKAYIQIYVFLSIYLQRCAHNALLFHRHTWRTNTIQMNTFHINWAERLLQLQMAKKTMKVCDRETVTHVNVRVLHV